MTTGVSQNGQGRASRDEKFWSMKRCVCSVHYFLEELGPFALQMTHTAKTVIVININNQIVMEVKFIGNTPAPDMHSLRALF